MNVGRGKEAGGCARAKKKDEGGAKLRGKKLNERSMYGTGVDLFFFCLVHPTSHQDYVDNKKERSLSVGACSARCHNDRANTSDAPRERAKRPSCFFSRQKKKVPKKRLQATVQAGRCPIRMAGVRDWRAAGLFVPKLPEFLGYAAS